MPEEKDKNKHWLFDKYSFAFSEHTQDTSVLDTEEKQVATETKDRDDLMPTWHYLESEKPELKPLGGNTMGKVTFLETMQHFPDALADVIRDPKTAFAQVFDARRDNKVAKLVEENKPLPTSVAGYFAAEFGRNIGITAIEIGRNIAKTPLQIYKTFRYFGQAEQPKWENRFLGEIESYPEISLRKMDEYIDAGIDVPVAATAAILGASGEAILDCVVLSGLITSGANALAKREALAEEKIAAYKLLGEPKDTAMAQKNWHQLSHQFHPDLMGGSNVPQAQINNAYKILQKSGLPTSTDFALARAGYIGTRAMSPLSRITELPNSMATLPFPQLPAEAASLSPSRYQAIKIPQLGVNKVPSAVPVTQKQLASAHILAQEKGLITSGKVTTPAYRALAKSITGKDSMKNMTQAEANDFINSLKAIETPKPVTQQVAQDLNKIADFKPTFKEPTLARYITPSDTYARVLGTYELVEPLIRQKTKLEIARADMFRWLDGMEKYILKIEGISSTKRTIAGLVNKPTEAHKKWFQLLNTYSTAEKAGLKGEEAKVFNELRRLTDTMLARTNQVRVEAGLEPIKKMDAYVTHLRDVFGKAEIRERHPITPAVENILNYINPKHIHNPTALKRMVEQPDRMLEDPFRALKAMVSMDMKQIYLEHPNALFHEHMLALKDVIPHSTRKWTEHYVREVILGYPTSLDKMTNETLSRIGIIKIIDAILKPFGRKLGVNPAKAMSGQISRLVHDATIWGRAKLPIRNLTQRFLTLGLYDSKAFLKGLAPASPELKSLIKNNDFWKISNKQFMEALPKSAFGLIERAGFMPYGKSHVSNVTGSMKTAYHAGMELVNNPKYAKYKWTKEDVLKEMEFGANTTQFWYNLMGMPEIYRSGGTRLLGVLQSWWQNYTMKYWREMITRAATGKTGWGKSIPPKWRIGAARHITASLLFTEGVRRAFGLDYGKFVLIGALPSYLSPPGQIAISLYKYLVADNDYQRNQATWQLKQSWRAMVPGSMAWQDYSKAWDTGNLKELFFYIDKSKQKKSEFDIDWEAEMSSDFEEIDWSKEL